MNTAPATIFIAFDGTKFFEKKDCVAYEAAHWRRLLEGLTAEQIERALRREDVERADAIEKAGAMISRLRLAAGEKRRKRTRGSGEPETSANAPEEETA